MSALAAVQTGAEQPPDLLDAMLRAVHAAIYGYGVLGARLDNAQQRLARDADDALRTDRDTLAGLLRDAGQDVPGPLAAYDVAISDPAAALQLATGLEEGLALRWGDLVGGTDNPDLRTTAAAGMRRSAVRAAQWREIGGLSPTVPFPGGN